MSYQVIIIGGGTAGYVAAIRCAQLGLKTACIDKWINKQGKPALGGTCLNVGCIPSKALLESSHHFADLTHLLPQHGISVQAPKLDSKAMIARKDKIVSELTSGIEQLFKANKIDWLQGTGTVQASNTVAFTDIDGKQTTLTADNIIIATGSVPSSLPLAPFDGNYIVSSEEALNWEKPPKSLAVIGAGAIGLEMGSIWKRAGSEVSIFKPRKGLIPEADPDVSKWAERSLKSQGIRFCMGIEIQSIAIKNKLVHIQYINKADNSEHTEKFHKLLIAIGRKPYTEGVLATESAIKIDERGFINVDEKCRTDRANIYAIGDVVRGPMLAHKGSEEGIMVAETIAGQHGHINYSTIPMVIYTAPEIAWVGETEQQAQERGAKTKSGKFSFAASGRAKASGNTDGMVKIVSDADTDRVLGMHIVGSHASELIGQGVLALETECITEDLQRTCFAHPSLSEAIHEAALDADTRAIHMVSRKKR